MATATDGRPVDELEHEQAHERGRESDSDDESAREHEDAPLLNANDSEHLDPQSRPKLERRPTVLVRLLSNRSIPRAARVVALQFVSINILWPFVPLGLVVGALHWKTIPTPAFNFLAIIPLSAAVSDASDKLSDQFGDLWGALINATFGNAVELIVGILAVCHGDTAFAQSVMLGSILSDILFVFGGCLFSSAWREPILKLNTAVSGALSSLMIITAVALILPTALYSTFESASSDLDLEPQILAFSRGTAIVLLVLYIAYLHFEFTRKDLFDPQPVGTPRRHDGMTPSSDGEEDTNDLGPSSLIRTCAILLAAAAGIMFCAHFLLDTINETSEATHISRTFIATILIPIASNAPECATVIGSSQNGRIDFAVAVIVSSILQIALFVVPVLVLLGAVVGQPMTLNFETFQTVVLFLAVILVNYLLQNGKYTYMHGLTSIALYAVLAIAFFLRNDI